MDQLQRLSTDQHSLYLLIALLAFLILTPFLEHRAGGEFMLLTLMYVCMVTATRKLTERGKYLRPTIALVVLSMVLMALARFYPLRPIEIANYLVLTVFLCLVCGGLFLYAIQHVGQRGAITTGHLYASVSLYLLIAVLWYSIYNLLEAVAPASFVEAGVPAGTKVPHSTFLYFSLVTLTTLGYGDVLPVTPVARMFAGLEATAGVLYIAITVARLVAGYQGRADAANE
jgi:voltage-gated potassium channel